MSGTHKFTSSVWIQSGSSPATFQSGIQVTGDINATKFVGDGSGITGLGTSVFFAGSGSGISASSPSSIDHIIILNASAATAPADYFRIETTSSGAFKPNHFVFVKLTDKFETLQAGSQDFYIGDDRTVPLDTAGEEPFTNDLAPGVHRYVVYATDTGSLGQTHAVYTSAFIKGYVNVAPIISAPLQSNGVVQVNHDSNTLTHILRFTGSSEPNQSENDFIRVFSASRSTIDPTSVTSIVPSYNLTMQHHQSDILNSDNLIATGSVDPSNPYLAQRNVYGAGDANTAALPNSSLVFTASISDYNSVDVKSNKINTIEPREERFTITMFDNWFVDHSSSLEYSMSIVPPNTASIRQARIRYESKSFTGITTDTFTTPILYDDVTTRDNIAGLHDRYTASLVRVSVMADITEPEDYESDGTHFTDIRLLSDNGSDPLHQRTFRFSGSMSGPGLFKATASAHGTDFTFNDVTESLGFSPFIYPAGTFNSNIYTLYDTDYLRHGDHHHISRLVTAGAATLTVNAVPDIEISNVCVEVESGSFLTGKGAFERSASVLYGYTSSLQVAETSSLEGYEKSAEYISESVVRLRLLATVTEPFGPHHTNIISTLETTLGSDYAHSYEFQFHTGSGATYTASSAIVYDGQDRLVGNYTSSWINFNLLPGQYTFSASFDSNTNAGRTITPGTYAEVSVSNTPPTEITNIRYETETAGYSYTGSTDAMRTVLYGVPRHTLADSSSFEGHVNAVTYASHSVSRFRVLANITEPFGPHHTASRFEKVWTATNESPITDVIHFSTGSTDTASSAIVYDSANRLLARYTSSWIGRQLSSGNNTAKIWTYTSGSITHTPHDLSGFISASGISTQLKVNDTVKVKLTNRIHEFEEYGHSASSAADTGVTETIRTVLYGNNSTTLADSSSLEGHSRKTAYASQSVSRVRMRVRVTEPVGPGIGSVGLFASFVDGRTKSAYTNSADFESISHAYDSQKRLVSHYTESWHGEAITLDTPGTDKTVTAQFLDFSIADTSTFASGENGIDKTEAATNANVTVRDTAPTEITNVRYQTETFGYSGESSIDTTRKVLYGIPHYTALNSASFELHDSASLYASQSVTRFRVLATVTEPVGPLHTASMFERVWSSPLQDTLKDIIYFSTASGDITASSAIAYDSSNRYVAHYTSSWTSQSLSSSNYTVGEEWKYTSGSILHEPVGENGFITSSGKSTTMTVFDTQPTQFSNFKTETETFGYSNEPTQNAFRKVLYGVAHKTIINSSSFESHDSASLYASQSVSQFRIVARITEPVGPLQHTTSQVEKIFNYGVSTNPDKTEVITFNTQSIGFESSRSFFTPVGEFVTEYTTSFQGKELEVQSGANAEREWTISTGSVIHNPYGENSANSSSFTATFVNVRNTDSVKIEKIFWETETFGYSNIETSNGLRTVLYGNSGVTDIDSSSYESHVNSGSYASQSVSRIRFRSRITEPIGPAVNAFSASFTHGGDISEFGIHTGSIQNGGDISFSYVDNQLVAHYTSSYIGREFDTIHGSEKIHNLTGNFNDLTSGENGLDQTDETLGQITVKDTAPTQIDNISYETETYGYSEIETLESSRTILYGDKHVTNIDSSSFESHDSASLYASQSVSRFRIRARITEPVGPLHTASRFEKVWKAPNRLFSDVIHFSTASGDITASSTIGYNSSNQLVSEYTSQWIGKGLSSSIYHTPEIGLLSGEIYTYTSGSISHEPVGETGAISSSGNSTTITVFDTQPTQFNNILLETETFGYSGIGATSGIRKVLYGIPHHTIESTESVYWANHDSASLYASQSVTQFRVYTEITEPVGPLHTGSIIRQQFTSNQLQSELISGVNAIANITNNQPVAGGDIASAFNGSAGNGYDADENEILYIVFNEPQIITKIDIDSDPPVGDFANAKVEASPDGGIVYYTQENIIGNTITPDRPYRHFKVTFANDDEMAINEVQFYRATFTEPIIYNDTTFNLLPGTSGIESSESFYDAQSRLVSRYTSSYFGIQLSSSNNTDGELWQHSVSQIIHTPSDESLITQPTNPTTTTLRVYDTKAPQYENFKTETETFGYSNEITQNALRTVLYGNAGVTDIDSASYAVHVSASVYTSHSVSRFRTLARIIEPVGPLEHTGSRSEMKFGTDQSKTETITFGTGSSSLVKSYWTLAGEFISEYTSSWVSKSLESGTDFTEWTIQNDVPIHQPYGENAPTDVASATIMRVNNTAPTEIDSIAYETETHGYSEEPSLNTTRKVLYGVDRVSLVDSSSFADHPNSSSYASHSVSRFRVRARVTEPVGPLHTASRFDEKWFVTSVGNIPAAVAATNVLHFSTASTNVTSHSYSDTTGRFIVEYTSSYSGIELRPGIGALAETSYTYTSGSISHEPVGETGFVTASGDSAELTVINTAQTQIRNIRIETETVGHSAVGVQNTNEATSYAISRSILYGDMTTNANSASFEGLNSIFAEKSVTRLRVLADIIEPLGPHHTGSRFAYTKTIESDNGFNQGEGNSEFIIFSTASVQTASSTIAYNDSTKELEAAYTSSWFGETLSPSRVNSDGKWHINIDIDNNVFHNPLHSTGVNIDTAANDLYMVVSASNAIEVDYGIEVESFYSSSIKTDGTTRSENILYGYNRTLSASDANTIGDIWSGSAAIRLRPVVKITEPLGFRHFPVEVTMSLANVGMRGYQLHTASLETSSRSDRVLNTMTGEHVTSYTGSFHDGFTFAEGVYAFIPVKELVTTSSGHPGIYDLDLNRTIKVNNGDTANIDIDNTPDTAITNIRIEVETFSGSAEGSETRTTKILHGNTVTETDKAANAGYPNTTAIQQLTSVRLLADIAEPFGPHHTASIFTITGYDSSHTIRLHTGSADATIKSQQMYDEHGSASVAYTSSFVPIEMVQGTFNTSVAVEHEFEDSKTTSEGTHATITVQGAPAATVTVDPQTGSAYWSSSVDIDKYVTYDSPGDITVEIISGISATAPTETSESVLTFPQHLNILYTESDSELSFSPITGNSSNEDTASLTISDTSMDDFTEVKEFTINVSGSDILPGSGSSGNSSLTFSVIPARPQTIIDKYWSTSGIGNHVSTNVAYATPGINVPSVDNNTTRLYRGTLAAGLGNYDNDPNQTSGTVTSNIVMAKDSPTGPVNYKMSFTPFDASNTGNYTTITRLFDHGDIGSLQVRVNDETVVDYSLQTNFRSADKAAPQDIANNYAGNGTASFTGTTYGDAGRLIVTRVEPFNGVDDDILAAGIHYPNGYQGWSARIELDDKLRDGYNKLEFSHVFDDGTSQDWTPFEWYYDDNVNLATTRANATASLTNSPDLFSLSGVSFFKPGVDIDLKFEDAFSNIAGQTYRDLDGTVLETTLGTGIQIDVSSTAINHDLNTNPNGLHFGEEVVNVTPTYNIDTGNAQSASLRIENLQATSVTNAETGENKTLTFKHFNRDYSVADSFTKDGVGTSLSVGRFATEPTTTSTNLIENFFNETYRYKRDTMENNRNIGQVDGYWINTANADYDSTQNILNTEDLQVHYTGELQYPQNEYPSHLPNIVDYRTATGDRYYYRAFDLGSGTATHRSIKITLFYDPSNALLLTDFTAGEEIVLNGNEDTIHIPSTVDFDATSIRVDICLPGPLPSSAANTNNNPGTRWGCVTALTTEGNPSTVTSLDDWNSLSINDGKYTILEENQTGGEDTFGSNHTAPANAFTILMGMGSINTKFSKGIVLCRVRFKDSATNVRQKLIGLKIEPI